MEIAPFQVVRNALSRSCEELLRKLPELIYNFVQQRSLISRSQVLVLLKSYKHTCWFSLSRTILIEVRSTLSGHIKVKSELNLHSLFSCHLWLLHVKYSTSLSKTNFKNKIINLWIYAISVHQNHFIFYKMYFMCNFVIQCLKGFFRYVYVGNYLYHFKDFTDLEISSPGIW